ncbi:unnamed protein product [Rotaria magnacalcarata]|uniref:Uncharacterized protein n=2 Tax=Rotaria magnacalcarata TaxID=392030 RepID=A0A8S3DLP9_9BILA|nr:unnamed protein product [Rotaria magnacalcarata]
MQVLTNLPLAREIQPGLAHARRLLTPVLPLSSLFDIPDSYQITLKYETFLFSDSLVSLVYLVSFQIEKALLINTCSLKGLAVSMNRTFKPARVMSDYEVSIITAVANEQFIVGVFFHFTQAIYRRIQSLGLITSYSQDSDIRICCRKLMALALLPIDQIETSFYNLRTKSSAAVKQELHQLFLYFDHQWIANVPMKMWSVHGYQHRTNNNCEGKHVRSD